MTTVPFVAMWSGEREYQGPMKLGPEGIVLPRADPQGVHWIPFLNAPGTGMPLFGQVHSMRQIKCMRAPRCQVCGERMPKTDCTWVLNGSTDPVPDGGPLPTMTPPTCVKCVPLARVECPHVARLDPLLVLRVQRYRVVGVFGDVFVPGMGGHPIAQGMVEFGHEQIAWLLARQLVVELQEYKIETPTETERQQP